MILVTLPSAVRDTVCRHSNHADPMELITASPPVMRFSWEPRNSVRTLLARGFDFEFATGIFTTSTLERIDPRADSSAPRRLAVGIAEGIPLTLLYVQRMAPDGHPVRHLLAARQALTHEHDAYLHARPSA